MGCCSLLLDHVELLHILDNAGVGGVGWVAPVILVSAPVSIGPLDLGLHWD